MTSSEVEGTATAVSDAPMKVQTKSTGQSNVKPGQVYRRADGKLVRKVVRKKVKKVPKTDSNGGSNNDAPTKTTTSTPVDINNHHQTHHQQQDDSSEKAAAAKKEASMAAAASAGASKRPPSNGAMKSATATKTTRPSRQKRPGGAIPASSLPSGGVTNHSLVSHQTMQSHEDRAAAVQGFEADLVQQRQTSAKDDMMAKKKAAARRPPNNNNNNSYNHQSQPEPVRPGAVPVAGNRPLRNSYHDDESIDDDVTRSGGIEPVVPTRQQRIRRPPAPVNEEEPEVFENETGDDLHNNNPNNLLEARPVDEEDPRPNGLVVTGYLVPESTTTAVTTAMTTPLKTQEAVPMGNSNTNGNLTPDEQVRPKSSNGRHCRWVILGVLLALLVAGAAAGVLFVFVFSGDDSGDSKTPKSQEGPGDGGSDDGPGDGGSDDGPGGPKDPPPNNSGNNDDPPTISPSLAPSPVPVPTASPKPTTFFKPSSAPSVPPDGFFDNPLLDQVTPVMHTYDEWTLFFVEWGFFLDDCEGTAPVPPPALVVTCQARPDLENLDRNIHLMGQLENEDDRFTTSCEPSGSEGNTLRCVVEEFGVSSPPPKEFKTTLLFVCGGDSVNQALPLRTEIRNVRGTDCGTREFTDDETQLTEFHGEVSTGVAIGMVCIDEIADGSLFLDQSDTFCNAEEFFVGDALTCVNDSSCQSDLQFDCNVEDIPIITARNNLDDNIFGQKQCAFTEKLVSGEFDYDIEELWTLALENGFGENDFAAMIHLSISLFPGLPNNNFEP